MGPSSLLVSLPGDRCVSNLGTAAPPSSKLHVATSHPPCPHCRPRPSAQHSQHSHSPTVLDTTYLGANHPSCPPCPSGFLPTGPSRYPAGRPGERLRGPCFRSPNGGPQASWWVCPLGPEHTHQAIPSPAAGTASASESMKAYCQTLLLPRQPEGNILPSPVSVFRIKEIYAQAANSV